MAEVYAQLATLKQMLTISDSARDADLNSKLAAASRSIEDFCGRRFDLDATASARVYRPADRVAHSHFIVEDIGSSTGLIVERGNAVSGWTVITTETEIYPENADLKGEPITALYREAGWCLTPTERLRVTARWGWPAVPEGVVQATLIYAARLYRRKDSTEGVLGSSEWGVARLTKTDPDVVNLIQPHALIV